MSNVIQVVLSNARHPEYGQFTIPFPIPQDAYDDMVEALKNMEIGDPILQDCHVDELESSYSILKRLEKTNLIPSSLTSMNSLNRSTGSTMKPSTSCTQRNCCRRSCWASTPCARAPKHSSSMDTPM